MYTAIILTDDRSRAPPAVLVQQRPVSYRAQRINKGKLYLRRFRFSENKRETLERVDSQIAELHKQRKSTFYASLSLEFMARILGCLEVYFILNILTTDVSFPACILIMAFTSLFANLFFFSPMQLGAREGGFALAVGGLAIPGAFGVYTGLITRVRELIWIVIGVLLMKVGNGTPTNKA